ncbi:hypothetical protein Lal_00019388 [Lupinus albus]|nr:hypothetical protein Lal_00019388 [Lupinus albus]
MHVFQHPHFMNLIQHEHVLFLSFDNHNNKVENGYLATSRDGSPCKANFKDINFQAKVVQTFFISQKMSIQRFVVPISYLKQPLFQDLLSKAEEEFGFEYRMGNLMIPCPIHHFVNLTSHFS